MKENSLKSPLSQYIFCGSLNFLACISYVHSSAFFPSFFHFVFVVFCSLSYTFLLVIFRYSFFACSCCHFSFHQIVHNNTDTHTFTQTRTHKHSNSQAKLVFVWLQSSSAYNFSDLTTARAPQAHSSTLSHTQTHIHPYACQILCASCRR